MLPWEKWVGVGWRESESESERERVRVSESVVRRVLWVISMEHLLHFAYWANFRKIEIKPSCMHK